MANDTAAPALSPPLPRKSLEEYAKIIKAMNSKNDWISLQVILFNVGVAVTLSLLISLICGHIGIGFAVGFLVWGTLLFKTPLFEMFTINLEPNWGIVLSNQFLKDAIPVDPAQRILPFTRKSMRELSSRELNLKWPWEVVVGSAINLQAEIIIGENAPIEITSSDDIPLRVHWQDRIVALRGFLVNHVSIDEAASVAFIRGEFAQAIMVKFRGKKEEVIREELPNLAKDFESVFGGENCIDPREEQIGMGTTTPQITGIERDPKYKAAAQAASVGEKYAEALKKIQTSEGAPMDTTIQGLIAAEAAGITPKGVNYINIGGLTEKSTPREVTDLLIAAREHQKAEQKKKGGK